MPADADSPISRHLPPIPRAWMVAFDVVLIGLASMAASIVSRIYVGGTPTPGDVLPAGTQGYWVAWTAAHCTLVPLALVVQHQYRVFTDLRKGWSLGAVLAATVFSFGGLVVFLYFLGQPVTDAQARVTAHFGITFILLAGWRWFATTRLRKLVNRGKRVRNVLLVGDSPALDGLGVAFAKDALYGRRVMGFVRSGALPSVPSGIDKVWQPNSQVTVEQATVENSVRHHRHLWAALPSPKEEDRQRITDGLGVEELFLANHLPDDEIAAWLRLAQDRGIDAHLLPRTHDALVVHPQPWMLGNQVVLDVHGKGLDPLGWAAKRALDIVVGSIGLLLASPLILAAVIAIKVENPKSPMFYGGTRVGFKGRHFRQWKLATMRPDADKFRDQLLAKNAREGPWFQLDEENDPRISKVGKFLRKYSLNDLPQFWNVVRGSMSIVGPRPLAADEASRFVKFDFRYYQCFDVKPGITGLWQVSNRMDPSFEYRFKLDMEYVTRWSIWLDLKLMALTPVAMLRGGR